MGDSIWNTSSREAVRGAGDGMRGGILEGLQIINSDVIFIRLGNVPKNRLLSYTLMRIAFNIWPVTQCYQNAGQGSSEIMNSSSCLGPLID